MANRLQTIYCRFGILFDEHPTGNHQFPWQSNDLVPTEEQQVCFEALTSDRPSTIRCSRGTIFPAIRIKFNELIIIIHYYIIEMYFIVLRQKPISEQLTS